ncbi:hypothetical protein HF324_05060 [Chitinophaga oryzae]|uniref:Uncharacterized protein n=1 Tax=Chitinophaga oryzae TaxID=2725414 RepID=A0ABX6LAX2_9BACT|nr:hypothetical protein [Chitinophaga oryzae]QJB37253.1 hypothetical protein HF324_05060 [Chitinophaga oryzae]
MHERIHPFPPEIGAGKPLEKGVTVFPFFCLRGFSGRARRPTAYSQ